MFSDGNEYLSTSSQVDSMLDDSTRIDPECASVSSQGSFSKEDGLLNGMYHHYPVLKHNYNICTVYVATV